MGEGKRHSCEVLVCQECGRKYSAKKTELLSFVPFNMKRQVRE